MPTSDSSGPANPWGTFEPPTNTMEGMFPVKSPVLQEAYAHARREWWYSCRRVYHLLVEASRYGPSVTGDNVSREANNLVRCEAVLGAIRAADIQMRRAK